MENDMRSTPYGWFTSPDQMTPVFDPGLDVPCPCCLEPLRNGPRKTISVMPVERTRSYFFRAHKACWEATTEETRILIESSIIDGDSAH